MLKYAKQFFLFPHSTEKVRKSIEFQKRHRWREHNHSIIG